MALTKFFHLVIPKEGAILRWLRHHHHHHECTSIRVAGVIWRPFDATGLKVRPRATKELAKRATKL
jgi:hypothetical protein